MTPRALRLAILPALSLLALFPLSLSAQDRPPYASRSSANAPAAPRQPSASRQPAATEPSGPERELFDSVNRERAAEGVPPLKWDPTLAAAARKHTLRMSQERLLDHQYSGEPSLRDRVAEAGAHFSVAAENIAIGKDAEAIHMAWMHSPGHRGNILDPQLTAIGISTVERRGYMFATQDFSLAVEDLSFDQQEKRVASLLAASGFRPVTATDDARKTCAVEDGYSGKPTSLLRFETSDLTKLPDNVISRLNATHSRAAQVGACPSKGAPGFTRYRLAILFF